jgi:hypothetical protein
MIIVRKAPKNNLGWQIEPNFVVNPPQRSCGWAIKTVFKLTLEELEESEKREMVVVILQ